MNKVFGLLGYPIQHSLSPLIFSKKFLRDRIENAEYRLFAYEELATFMDLLHHIPEIAGFNVTSPHKRAILPFIENLSDLAAKLQSVNVVKVYREPDGTPHLHGFNSDVEGFNALLMKSSDNLQSIRRKKALICGTGGAASAAVYALLENGFECVCASRRPEQDFSLEAKLCSYESLREEAWSDYGLIVQATPLGMASAIAEAPDIPYDEIAEDVLCLDLVYSPGDTVFLQKCRQQKAKVSNGLPMLYGQAEKAWQVWSEDN